DPTSGEINLLSSSGGVYTITYEVVQNGCSNAGATSVSLTVDASCVDIPRGFSPNNDGANESFDLTGLDVRNVIIYNRYGREVYSVSGDYTNQWKGVSNK
ncbi:MAG TPA: gliding motility-associated C-terminal domain-containing protein, partial [Flavobacterium sp.]|nr:gliding motility-associated C-terminal domain-containing protein [Flavobacterium sp.]